MILLVGGHCHSVSDVTAARSGKACCAAGLTSREGHASKDRRKSVSNYSTRYITGPRIRHHDGISILRTGDSRCFSVGDCDLQIGFVGDVSESVALLFAVFGSSTPFGAVTCAVFERLPVAAALTLPLAE